MIKLLFVKYLCIRHLPKSILKIILFFYAKRWKIPKTKSNIIPKILPYIPKIPEEYLPINNPIKVNEKAQILNITPDITILLEIALNPSPVEKLSKETDTAIKSILMMPKSKCFSSLLNRLISISMPIKIRIIPKRKLTLTFKNLTIFSPKIKPNKGIKKCRMPTSKLKRRIFLLEILKEPIDKLIENVSIDKEIPIKNKDKTIDTLSP